VLPEHFRVIIRSNVTKLRKSGTFMYKIAINKSTFVEYHSRTVSGMDPSRGKLLSRVPRFARDPC